KDGRGGLSRRALLQAAGGGGVAAAAIVGLGAQPAAAQAGPAAARTPVGPLKAADPHALTGRRRPRRRRKPDAAEITILPIDRAKFLAGAKFDLRVEAVGVDPETARIDIRVKGPKGPAEILVGEPERTSSADDSLEVTYRGLHYPDAGDYTVQATVRS